MHESAVPWNPIWIEIDSQLGDISMRHVEYHRLGTMPRNYQHRPASIGPPPGHSLYLTLSPGRDPPATHLLFFGQTHYGHIKEEEDGSYTCP